MSGVYCWAHGFEPIERPGCVLPVWSDAEQKIVGVVYVPITTKDREGS